MKKVDKAGGYRIAREAFKDESTKILFGSSGSTDEAVIPAEHELCPYVCGESWRIAAT